MGKMNIILTDDNKIIVDCEEYQGDACLDDVNGIILVLRESGIDVEVGDVIRKEEDRVRDVGRAGIKN